MQRLPGFSVLGILSSVLIYEIIIVSLTFVAEQSFAQSLPKRESHVDETLPVLEVSATRSDKRAINVPVPLSKISQPKLFLDSLNSLLTRH